MYNSQTLIDELALPRTKNWVDNLCVKLYKEGFVLTDLLNLTLHAHGQTAFHAVWLLDTVVLSNLNKYANELPLFITYGQRIKHHSCQRHYARIFMYYTAAKAAAGIKAAVAKTDLEPMIELCFDWLIDPKTKVAVKAFASETLCNVHQRYDWVAYELQNQLGHLMKNGSPAIQSTGRRLLKTLQA